MADYQARRRTRLESPSIDRISDLPSNIIDNILSLVPLRDAGKTSVLSKKWRYRWLNTPSLVFNHQFGWIPLGEPYPEDKMNKILLDIFQILLRHQGPLHTFSLCVGYLRRSRLIDQIMLYLSGTIVQYLQISCLGYEIPCYLFKMLQLRTLSLHFCFFTPPPASKGFSRLTYLQLEDVTLRVELDDFILKCPLLSQLKVHNCMMYSERLELNAPNLNSFSFEGIFWDITFKNTPILEDVRILSDRGSLLRSVKDKTSIFSKIIGCLPGMKSLHVSHRYLKYLAIGGLPDKIPTKLNVLKIWDLHFEDVFVISSILCLIRSSPNLQELQIEMSRDRLITMPDDVEVQRNSNPDSFAGVETVAKLIEAQAIQYYISNQLRCVEFLYLTSSRSAMEFVKFMLGISLHLEKMVIMTHDADEEIRILRECNQFRRASPIALVFVVVL